MTRQGCAVFEKRLYAHTEKVTRTCVMHTGSVASPDDASQG
jgi:hypothetical protein